MLWILGKETRVVNLSLVVEKQDGETDKCWCRVGVDVAVSVESYCLIKEK